MLLFSFCAEAQSITQEEGARDVEGSDETLGQLEAVEARRLEARQLFVEGSKEAKSEEWSQALELYLESQSLYPHSTTLYNVGHCYGKLGQYSSAWYFTERALHPTALTADRRLSEANERSANEQLRNFEEELGRLVINLGTESRLIVNGNRPVRSTTGVLLVIEGQEGAQEPISGEVTLLIEPGEHSLRFQSEKEEGTIRVVTAQGGVSHLTWPELATSATPEVAPAPELQVSEAASVPAASDERVSAPQPEASRSQEKWLRRIQWTGFGVGAAGGITALVAGIVASTTASSLNDACDPNGVCPTALEARVLRHERAVKWTNVGIWTALSGVCVGAGATLLRHQLKDGRQLAAEAIPGGLRVKGSF